MKLVSDKYDSILLSSNLKFEKKEINKNNESEEKIGIKTKNEKQNLIYNQLEQNDNNKNKIDILEKIINKIKNDNIECKEFVKKINNEFNLIKIRFSEVLDFIKDKYFWKKFISKIIKENKFIEYRKNNKKENLIEINNIYNPFNYYEHFGIEELKYFLDKGCSTRMSDGVNQNFLKDEFKKDALIDNNKFQTMNNTPKFNIS